MADQYGVAQLKVRLDPQRHRRLKEIALRRDMSLSDIVREVLDQTVFADDQWRNDG